MKKGLRPVTYTALLVLGGIAGANQASATPVEWTLTNVAASDGQTLAGSFVFDAETSMLSSIAISSSAGTSFDSAIMGFSNVSLLATDSPWGPGTAVLDLRYASALTDLGGTIPLTAASKMFYCVAGSLPGTCATDPLAVSPTLTGYVASAPAVPLPAALWLLVSGLTGMWGFGRRGRTPSRG